MERPSYSPDTNSPNATTVRPAVLCDETKDLGWALTSDFSSELLVENINLMLFMSVNHLQQKAVTGVHEEGLEHTFLINLHERCVQIILRVLKKKFDLVTVEIHVLLGNAVTTRRYLTYRMRQYSITVVLSRLSVSLHNYMALERGQGERIIA